MTSLCKPTRPLLPCPLPLLIPARLSTAGKGRGGLPTLFCPFLRVLSSPGSSTLASRHRWEEPRSALKRSHRQFDSPLEWPTIYQSQLRAGPRLGCDRGPSKWRALVGQGLVSGRTDPRPSMWTAHAILVEVPAKPAICYRSTHASLLQTCNSRVNLREKLSHVRRTCVSSHCWDRAAEFARRGSGLGRIPTRKTGFSFSGPQPPPREGPRSAQVCPFVISPSQAQARGLPSASSVCRQKNRQRDRCMQFSNQPWFAVAAVLSWDPGRRANRRSPGTCPSRTWLPMKTRVETP
jgi:hypothetical protein